MITITAVYRLELLRRADRTHGGDYWAWSLTSIDGEHRDGGRVDELVGTYHLDGGDPTAEAERVWDQVCHQCDIDRRQVVLSMDGKSW